MSRKVHKEERGAHVKGRWCIRRQRCWCWRLRCKRASAGTRRTWWWCWEASCWRRPSPWSAWGCTPRRLSLVRALLPLLSLLSSPRRLQKGGREGAGAARRHDLRDGDQSAGRRCGGRLSAACARLQAVRLRDLSRGTRGQGIFFFLVSPVVFFPFSPQACVSVLAADGAFNVDNVRTIKILGGGVVESTLLKCALSFFPSVLTPAAGALRRRAAQRATCGRCATLKWPCSQPASTPPRPRPRASCA